MLPELQCMCSMGGHFDAIPPVIKITVREIFWLLLKTFTKHVLSLLAWPEYPKLKCKTQEKNCMFRKVLEGMWFDGQLSTSIAIIFKDANLLVCGMQDNCNNRETNLFYLYFLSFYMWGWSEGLSFHGSKGRNSATNPTPHPPWGRTIAH